MSNIVLIPARGGSKGIKLKNITPVLEKPLIYYSLLASENAKFVDKIIVATDNNKINNVVKSFNFNKVEIYNRLKKNAKDTSKTIDLILEYSRYLKPEDTLILIQATSPLTTSEDIDNALKEYNKKDCDSILSCVVAEGFYWNRDGKPILHDSGNRIRRQEYCSPILKENGAIYINKVKNITKNKQLLTGKIKPFIMKPETKIEIDEAEDIIEAEKILRQRILASINFKQFKMLLVDCDGTLTDGGMYYSKTGEMLKKFNTKDGYGLREIQSRGFIVGIVTGEDSEIVKKRAEKLKIKELHMASDNKMAVVKKLAKKYKITLDEIVFIGDDLNDYEVIKSVGFGCATANANLKVKNSAKYITSLNGGMGAVREVIDLILSKI